MSSSERVRSSGSLWSRSGPRQGVALAAMLAALGGCGTGGAKGTIDVNGDGQPDGTALDLNGDGKVDAVDVDGDGAADGEDLDGDGRITIWSQLGADTLPPTDEQVQQSPGELDPDLIDDVDPMHAPPASSGGHLQIGPSLVPTDGTLGAISQGMQGSCAAFANAALVTALRGRREKIDPNTVWASPAFLYERQVRDTKTTCNKGTYIHAGLDALVREGAATWEEVPYRSAASPTVCEMGSTAAAGHHYRIGSWEMLRPFSRQRIKASLTAGQQIAFGVSLPPGFLEWRGAPASGVFKGTGTCSASQHCGGHAMVLVGYDDAKGAYRILNSWGTDWGDKGYLWWDYEDFEARKPYGYVVTEVPGNPPFTLPNASTFSLKAIGTVTWSSRVENTSRWLLTTRLEASEPIRISRVELTPEGGTAAETTMSAWFAYGNLPFVTGAEPPKPGPAKLAVTGTLRDGMELTVQVPIQIPQPTATSD